MTEEVERITGYPELDTPSEGTELRCEKCGKSLAYKGRGRKPRFCPECKPSGQTKKRGTVSTGNNVSGRTLDRTTDVVGRILIILTMVVAHQRLSRINIQNEQLEDDLSLSDEEADAIAKPLARWSLKSKTGSRILKPIVDNEDLIDAGIALWEYNRRTQQILNKLKERNTTPNGTVPTPRPSQPETFGNPPGGIGWPQPLT